MKYKNKKLHLILVLVLAVVLSALVFPVMAAEEPGGEADAVVAIQARIDAILTQYGITADMSDEEIAAAISLVDGDVLRKTMDEMEVIKTDAQGLSEEDFAQLDAALYGRFCGVMEHLTTPALIATTTTVLDGQVSITDTANRNEVSSGTVTLQAKGNLFNKGVNTITVKNETANTATLSFTYVVSSYNSFTIAGTSAGGSGTYSGILNAGGTVTLYLQSKSGLDVTTATLTLSNFSLIAAAAESNVTIKYDSTLGSVTVAGAAAASESSHKVDPTTGKEFKATPVSGAKFLGWIRADGTLESASNPYTLKAASDMTIRAAFASAATNAWFSVVDGSDTYLFNDLKAANTKALTSSSKTIVLAADGTLPAAADVASTTDVDESIYTIDSGVTLLIPFDAAGTCYESEPVSTNGYTDPTVFRTLTMADGAKIAISGKMSLSNKLCYTSAKNNQGSPTGSISMVKMQGSSSITVNNGGTLYAWGFITGSGSVTANNGATVYECFQYMDYRGGGQSAESGMDTYDIFPMSQYYVQNIEVPLTLYKGAVEYARAIVSAKPLTNYVAAPTNVKFIGESGCMFNLTNGHIVKSYEGSSDRLIIDINASISVAPIKLIINVSILGNKEIDSTNYDLPINSNMTINVNSGTTTISQDLALLPGSCINIANGATVKIASGYNVFVYDVDQWEEFCYSETNSSYSYHEDYNTVHWDNVRLVPVTYAPGRAAGVDRVADSVGEGNPGMGDATICVNGTLDASEGFLYTTTGPMTYKDATDAGAAGTEFPNYYNKDFDHTATPALKNHVPANADFKDYSIDSTLKGGAKIYSTKTGGAVQLASGSTTVVYQIIQDSYISSSDSDADYYISIPVTLAKLTHGNGELMSTTATTYNYHATHKRWYAGTHSESVNTTTATFDTAGTKTVSCVCGYSATKTTNVAQVGDVAFTILRDAIEGAQGETVTLLANVDGDVTVSQNVTIDKGSYSANISAGEGYYLTVDGNTYTVAAKFRFDAANMRMGNDLDMMFRFSKSAVSGWTGHYVVIERQYSADKDGVTKKNHIVTVPYTDWSSITTSDGSFYYVTYEGLAAKEMSDLLTLTVYNEDGIAVSYPWEDSLQKYGTRMAQNVDNVSLQRTMFVDMLNYGAAAQTYFGYGTNNLANSTLTDADKALASVAKDFNNTLDQGDKWVGSNIVLRSNISFMVAFKGMTTDMRATVEFYKHDKTEPTVIEVAGSEFGKSGTYYYVPINELVVADGRQPITITVYNADGTVYTSCQESIEAYLARRSSVSALFAAVMRYSDSAYAYLHRNDAS